MTITMQRPKLDKPRLQHWKSDDEELAKFLDHIDKKAFNVNVWEFRDPYTNKMLRYSLVAENVHQKFPSYRWVQVLRQSFISLPDHMRLIKSELFGIFKRIILNAQERANYIESLEKYADHAEKKLNEAITQIKKLDEGMAELNKKTNEKAALNNKNSKQVPQHNPIEPFSFSKKPSESKPDAETEKPGFIFDVSDALENVKSKTEPAKKKAKQRPTIATPTKKKAAKKEGYLPKRSYD